MTPEEMLPLATRFTLEFGITVEKRGDNSWAVVDDGHVYSRDGEWIYEPLPSNRSEIFIAETRFSLEDAFKHANDFVYLTKAYHERRAKKEK